MHPFRQWSSKRWNSNRYVHCLPLQLMSAWVFFSGRVRVATKRHGRPLCLSISISISIIELFFVVAPQSQGPGLATGSAACAMTARLM